jgi:hypothetical protein
MFLGIYLHAVVAYSPSGGWPYKPAQLTTTLDWSVGLIHVFRMPVFYVMAGFFAALLLQRYGLRRAADNRFWRIVVPFVVGWIILYPMVMFLAAVGRGGMDRALDFILSGRFLAYAHPLHLWFLEYLIVLYLLAIVAVMGVRPLPQDVRTQLLRFFRLAVQSWWAPLIFAVTGLFLRYLGGHSAFRRYLCDSSYFLYLAHMPVLIAFQLLLRDVPLPPLAKVPLALAATIAVLLPLYRYGVRSTFVGAILNGRKYPGAFTPTVAAAG